MVIKCTYIIYLYKYYCKYIMHEYLIYTIIIKSILYTIDTRTNQYKYLTRGEEKRSKRCTPLLNYCIQSK